MMITGLVLCVLSAPLPGAKASGKVKVFILAGQAMLELLPKK
jgi:hypothetical protein